MKTLLTILLVGTLASCASTPTLTARSDFDRSQDFSDYHTFAWMDPDRVIAPDGEDANISPLNRRRIVEAIERVLSEKGYRLVGNPASADFVLSFTVGARDRIDVDSYPATYRGTWYWGWPNYWRDVDVDTYREGTLAIDVFDGERHQPVWHGWATKRITEYDIENASAQIPVAVAAILEEFPDRAG